MGAIKVGDPSTPTPRSARWPPSASATGSRATSRSARRRAPVVTGGGRPDGLERGWFVEPTLFADVDNAMRIAHEEIFGPGPRLIPYDEHRGRDRDRQRLAYGLSGAVFADDRELAEQIARRVRTGQMCVNGWAMCVVAAVRRLQAVRPRPRGRRRGPRPYLETKVILGLEAPEAALPTAP